MWSLRMYLFKQWKSFSFSLSFWMFTMRAIFVGGSLKSWKISLIHFDTILTLDKIILQKHKKQLPVGILKTEKWKDIRQRDFFFFLQGQWEASFHHNSPAHDPQPDLRGFNAATVTQNIHERTKHRSLSNLNWKLLEGKMKQVTWLEVQRQVSTAQHGRND